MVKKEKAENIGLLGASFENPMPEELKKLKINNGLKVIGLKDGKLKNAGIREAPLRLELGDED